MSNTTNNVDVGFIWQITDDVLRDAFREKRNRRCSPYQLYGNYAV